jgi:hypothetical protein
MQFSGLPEKKIRGPWRTKERLQRGSRPPDSCRCHRDKADAEKDRTARQKAASRRFYKTSQRAEGSLERLEKLNSSKFFLLFESPGILVRKKGLDELSRDGSFFVWMVVHSGEIRYQWLGCFSVGWMCWQWIIRSSEKLVQGKRALDERSKDRMFFAAVIFKPGIAPTSHCSRPE